MVKTKLKKFDIAIIGLGAVSLSFLFQLNQNYKNRIEKNKLTVLILEKSNKPGAGYAYNTDDDILLLNTTISEMNISPAFKTDFIEWLNRINYPVVPYVPRYIFAKYLEDCYESIMNLDITIVKENAEDCIIKNDEVLIKSESQCFYSSYLVLSHGGKYKPISFKFKNNKFINDVYRHDLSDLDENSNILILGSNLTMIDACLLLSKTNKNFNVDVASRNAYFPSTKSETIDTSFETKINQYLMGEEKNINTYKDFVEFIDKIISSYFKSKVKIIDLINKYENDINSGFINNIFNYEDDFNISPISIYIDSAINRVWSRLSEEVKQQLSRVINYLMRFICGAPLVNKNKLNKYFCNDIKIKPLRNIEYKGKKFVASYNNEIKLYDYVINCTGIGGYYHIYNEDRLSKNIIKNNQLMINHHYGLTTNDSSQVMGTTGHVYDNIFAIGESSIGSNFIRSSFSFYAKQANYAVDKIIDVLIKKENMT